jgi:hypothetical protein
MCEVATCGVAVPTPPAAACWSRAPEDSGDSRVAACADARVAGDAGKLDSS